MSWNRFSAERFEVLQNTPRDHFWYAGRRGLVLSALRKSVRQPVPVILDIGCGPGLDLKTWKAFADQVIGIDRHARKTRPEILAEGVAIIAGDVAALPMRTNSADVVLALDVLEHVEEGPMLDEVLRVLVPGGMLIATVPAFNRLWSYRDEQAGHLRRYTKKSLETCLRDTGFEIQTLDYYQFFLFPLVILSRLFGRRTPTTRSVEDVPPALINWVFRAVNLFEVKLSSWGMRMPIGSSVIVVATKEQMVNG